MFEGRESVCRGEGVCRERRCLKGEREWVCREREGV